MSTTADLKSQWERLRQDDTEAMMQLYAQSYAGLLSYGVQLINNNELAKDAINDVFLELWDNRLKLKPVENVKAYLFACIRRKIFQTATINRKANAITDNTAVNQQQSDLSHEDLLVAMEQSDEIRSKVLKALDKLTDRQKELITLKYYKGLDYRQIETTTGISMKTAYNTVYNAMKILTVELRDIIFVFTVLFFF
ncbi:RNA polymerase sigma factor [Ferruginibacter sp.]|nr:sigma-70 family RNA polymerase sigma factor [Ferruginibacter sp.]